MRLPFVVVLCAAAGCGTTRSTDTPRAASEMLLVSQAVDAAVAHIDFTPLACRKVFLDPQYLDGTVDRGYVVSTLRQRLLASGARLQEERKSADVIVEARSGGVGTDRHSLLVGVPQMTVPTLTLGQPLTQIPEVALMKRTDQRGFAKLAVFAYMRGTGEAVWQSPLTEAQSTLKDTWVLGAGPFSRGTVRKRTELAGQPLPRLPFGTTPAEPVGPDELMPPPAIPPPVPPPKTPPPTAPATDPERR